MIRIFKKYINRKMEKILKLLLIFALFTACQRDNEKISVKKIDWEKRTSEVSNFETFVNGKTYLPVYSHVYHIHDQRTFDLTITISIRNLSPVDSLYILNAEYYNTTGDKIRQYIEYPVFLEPMETIEIVIAEEDKEGGSGANFVFDWAMKTPKNPPLFEAVMISTYGGQGVSFLTRGIPIYE
jgi:Protein of unknown function (DUF3124)